MLTPDVTQLREMQKRFSDRTYMKAGIIERPTMRDIADLLDALLAPPADPAMTGEGCPECGTTGGEAHQPTCRWRTPDGAAGEAESVGEPEWIVNDIGELGVRVGGRCFFLYKGESLEYGSSEEEIARGVALHDEGDPMRFRRVQKREFGETQWPDVWLQAGRREDRYCAGDGWRDLPARKPTPAPGEAPGAKKSPVDIWADPVFLAAIRAWSDKVRPDPVDDADFAAGWNAALSAARPAAPREEEAEYTPDEIIIDAAFNAISRVPNWRDETSRFIFTRLIETIRPMLERDIRARLKDAPRAEVTEAMVEALRFYADRANWRTVKLNTDPTSSNAEWDAGCRARAALAARGPA
jgi:hypothetical protein